ncbi:DUF1656 domain-containing protein [Acidiphilium sp. AL]|uniref:DUF1656 domain-containing protein n=1 Tax=Acidiphilium iwatense TaxID=768198 RepID=A0ABS9DSD0_9PROT|nr:MULTISPECIES: DUF1656 domain-containing protein [Acidiphilium]MCF3945095.1 DUF1656 domain-containing protein [Acidiphilium iwatense]MCU4160560.1 DUF1656 domain-containing protein [Acidiphilium sp. AL]
MTFLPHLAEFSIFGIGIEPAVPMLLLAVAIADVLRRVLTRLGFDRMVWNWPLFMFAVFGCIAGGLILAMPLI